MVQTLNLPKKVYFKSGCTPVALRELGEIYHCSRALLVTDPQLYRAGVTAPIIGQLRRQGIRAAEFFTIGKRVSVSDLRSALPKLNEFQPDVIVGVGGDNAMSAAKALLALYGDPDLDLAAAAADPARIPACAKAKLVLIATNFSSGSQNSPFAILKGEEGQAIVLKSIHLLPEVSVTDADFTAGLTAEQVRTCGLKSLSHAARAYLAPDCTELTAGMLTEAIAAVLKYTGRAMNGSPSAREKLHNAAALAGASYGNVVDAITPDLPYFPTGEEITVSDNDVRCAELAECLGFAGCRDFFSACQSV